MTNGKTLRYSPLYVLRLYKTDKDSVARQYLHIVMHCVLCHSFVGSKIDRFRWDIASDIAVESLIDELGIKGVLPSKIIAEKSIANPQIFCMRFS